MEKPLEITPTQRRYLKQNAHHLKPVVQVGKGGITQPLIDQLDEQLKIHELVKVKILEACMESRETLESGFAAAGATFVQKVGHVFTLFRQRNEDSAYRLPKQ